jgi:hypothetical protein
MIPCHCAGPLYFRFLFGSGPCASEKLAPPTILAWEDNLGSLTLDARRRTKLMDEDLERLKQHLPLLEYLQRHNWSVRWTPSFGQKNGCP